MRSALPNAGGLLGQQPNSGVARAPFAPGAANPRDAWPGRGGWGRGIPRAGGVPAVGDGASPTVAAAGANGGAAGARGATAGVPAGVGNQAGDGNQVSALRPNVLQCNAILYNAIRYNVMQYNAVEFSSIQKL